MDNDKGLYLPLRINLTEWEKSLASADAELQKTMKQMRAEVSDVSLKYNVEIATAKNNGNTARAAELENQKLNVILDAQKRAVNALNEAYRKSVKEKGANAKESKALAAALLRESAAMERTQMKLDARGFNLGRNISDSLANFSPEFAKIRENVGGITSAMGAMGGAAAKASVAIGGIGLAAAGLGAAYTAFEKLTQYVDETAERGRIASDNVYQLRERMQSSYADAEYVYGVAKIDGANAESLMNALVKLNATLKKDAEGTSQATLALRKYGAEMRNADGTFKSYKEQLEEIARAAQTAANAGQFADFKAAMKGGFSSGEFDHLLLGLDSYAQKAAIARTEHKKLYDDLHAVGDWRNTLSLAQEQTDAVYGGIYAKAATENLKAQVDTQVALSNLLEKNKERYEATAEIVGGLTNKFTKMKGAAVLAFEEWKKDSLEFDISDALNVGPAFQILNTIKKLRDGYREVSEEQERVANNRKQAEATSTNVKLNKIDDSVTDGKAEKAALDKQLAAQEQFSKELRDLKSSDYDREINQLNDRVQKWREAGISEVAIAERTALEKANIDKRYYEKDRAEREKQQKEQENAYRQQIENAKRAREASISEAESTLKSNLKLVRYIQKQRQMGTYNEEDIKNYANRLYMRQNGFRSSDISALKDIGVANLKELADARGRIFGSFANIPQQNNNVTINFDNTIVNDVAAMDMLANKVAGIILPTVQRAINPNQGGAQYGY